MDTPEGTPPVKMCGWVSSSYYSPNCESSIAMALVQDGLSRKGETVYAAFGDKKGKKITRTVECTIVDPVFFDKEGVRQNG